MAPLHSDRATRRRHLAEVGRDPDPRFTFANERTFLAWNRTALALIAAGLIVADALEIGVRSLRMGLGLLLIVTGAAIALTSYRRWERSERCLRMGRGLPYTTLPRWFAVFVGAVATVTAVIVAVALVRP